MKARQQSSTAHPMTFLMVLSSDHITGATGLSPTVTISKDGGAFASPSGAISEIGNGWYALAGNATDRNTLGDLLIHATAGTADPADRDYVIVGFDPFNSTNLGLSGLPAVDGSGRVILQPTQAGVTIPTVTTVSGAVGSVTGAVGSVTGNVNGNVSGNVNGTVNSVNGAVGSVSGNLNGNVGGNVNGAVNSVNTAVVLPSNGLDAIVIDGGYNLPQVIALIGSATAGNSTGVNAGTPTFYGIGSSGGSVRITGAATNGNRSLTVTPPVI